MSSNSKNLPMSVLIREYGCMVGLTDEEIEKAWDYSVSISYNIPFLDPEDILSILLIEIAKYKGGDFINPAYVSLISEHDSK